MGSEIWTNPLLTFIGGAGVISYAVHIHRERTRSSFELTLLVLLYCLAALFITRGLNWLTDDPRVDVPLFIPATLLPLALTLFIEALMRRHVPLALKVFVAGGTLVPFVLNLVPLVERDLMWAMSRVVTLGTFAWLGVLVVSRPRDAHAPMENRLIDGLSVALGIAFLLAITDMQLGPEWLDFRLGGIGGLIFVYVCVRLTDPEESSVVLFRELLGVTVAALVATGVFGLLLPAAEGRLDAAIFFVSLSLILLYTILVRLRALRTQSNQSSFFRWLLEADASSVEDFVDALGQLPLAEQHMVLQGSESEAYGPEAIARVFDGAHPVWTLSLLRSALSHETTNGDGAERLIGMLERNGMTHATLLSRRPYVFLLLNLPELGSHNPMLELALLHKYAGTLPRGPVGLSRSATAPSDTREGPPSRLR